MPQEISVLDRRRWGRGRRDGGGVRNMIQKGKPLLLAEALPRFCIPGAERTGQEGLRAGEIAAHPCQN